MAQKELVEAHRTAMNAQNAFLLGISASAIAFTFHSTSDRDLSMSTWLMLGAAAVWAVSFAAGIQKGQKNLDAISYNLAILEAQRIGLMEKAEEGVTKFDSTRKASSRLHLIQLWTLLGGAMIFAAGHIAYMANDVTPQAIHPSIPDQPTASPLPGE